MATLPGYSRIPGKAERFRTPEGKEISRRQYENIRLQAAGFKSWSEYQRLVDTKAFKRFRDGYTEKQGGTFKKATAPQSELVQTFKQMLEERKLYRKGRLQANDMNRPEGPLARILVLSGLRDERADYSVGESP